MSRQRSKGFSGDNEFNARIEREENNETNLLKPMTEEEKQENLNEFKHLADQIATLSLSDSKSSGMKTHINVMKKLLKDNLNKSSIDYKQRKKPPYNPIKRAAIYGGRKSRKLMCPKNCCGVPVTKCGCPKSCKHCNCHEIRRLRKKLRTCKKKRRRRKRTKKKRKRRRKKTRRRN